MKADLSSERTHDHNMCLQLARDFRLNSSKSMQTLQKSPNVLFYIRKSDDVDDILDALRKAVLHISSQTFKEQTGNKSSKFNIYMERWALDALATFMSDVSLVELDSFDEKRTLRLAANSNVILKEWLPEEDQTIKQLAITTPEQTYTEKTKLNEHDKQEIDFEYVFCIGGDGTLLRLLRILFFRFLPSSLPKILTFSMGSLGYLCNF